MKKKSCHINTRTIVNIDALAMGLNMRVYKVKQNCIIKNGTDLQISLEQMPDKDLQLFYWWLKHPDLHAWFLSLYKDKMKGRNKKDNINNICQTRWVVEVTLRDIELLKQLVILNALPKWKDSWLGNSNLKETADTIKFTLKAEDFWISQYKKDKSNFDETLVYCGYW